jgi:hypothetical protein
MDRLYQRDGALQITVNEAGRCEPFSQPHVNPTDLIANLEENNGPLNKLEIWDVVRVTRKSQMTRFN